MKTLGPAPDRTHALEALLPAVEGKPLAMAHLARLLQAEGQAERAMDLCLRARAAAPGSEELAALVSSILSADVPSWHFRIVRDDIRNRAYDEALRRAIRPGDRVFEIGAGSGLLAMMAARAGAGRVVTCEANPTIARMARDVVAANGLADRVSVVAAHSTAVDAAGALGGPVDVLVSEIISNDGLGEGVIPAVEDAWKRLLSPTARVIPMRLHIRVALAEDRRLRRGMGVVSGFDLSPFDVAAPHAYQVGGDAPRLVLRSEPATLFSIDFQRDRFYPSAEAAVPLVGTGGRVNGIAQWIALDMDEEGRYDVRPGQRTDSCWAVMFYPIETPLTVDAGRTVDVRGRHDRQSLHLWTAGEPR